MDCSTSLISPYNAFSKSLPPPPQWLKQPTTETDVKQVLSQEINFLALDKNPSGVPPSSVFPAQWKECSYEKQRLQRTLSWIATNLRSVHKRKIYWPENESFPNE